MTIRAPLLAFLSGLTIALSAVGCSQEQVASPQGFPAMAVKTVVAREMPIPDTSEYLATLKSRRSTALNPQVEGQVTDIFVKSGDRVTAGTRIIQIDPLKQQATVENLQAAHASQMANAQYAQTQWERMRQLYEAGVVSKQEYDQAQSTLDAAKQQLKSLEEQVSAQQVQLQYYLVVAPTSGILGDIPVHVGDRVGVTTLLTTVEELGTLELYLNVPVERSEELKLGQRVQLVGPAGGVEVESRIDFISPAVSTETQSILAKATFQNSSGTLRTSQYVRARLIWSVRQGVTVPVLSVSRVTGQYFVFVVEGQGETAVARQRMVRLGEVMGNDYPVIEGILPGDRVVVEGAQTLFDGAPVAETLNGE